MCATCGCGDDTTYHNHDHNLIEIEKNLLEKNNSYANKNRQYFIENNITAINILASPGAGKTTLLQKTIPRLSMPVYVIEGDQQTSRDADRLRELEIPVKQINTGKGCHLDAHMVGHAVQDLSIIDDSILFIENVGNLVCPAMFDLGESYRVVILSVTEGEDKPIKYPDMFYSADLMVLNKTDLLPHLEYSVDECIQYAKKVNPNIDVILCSALRGEGMDLWEKWLVNKIQHIKQSQAVV